MNNFVEKIIASKGGNVHYVKAIDKSGKDACYFILVDPIKESSFIRALENEEINFSDYGQILASCFGKNPTEYVLQTLKTKYGFEV